MNASVMLWLCMNIEREEIENKNVLEVGSQDVNGSIKDYVLKFRPSSYVGVDFQKGKNVDLVMNAEDLIEKLGPERFDVVISTEMLEHVKDWRKVIHNLKGVLKKGALLIVTTRSQGFPYHAFPYDYWRYGIEDFERIFNDIQILKLEKDKEPGVLLKAKKPVDFSEVDTSTLKLFSVLTNKFELNAPPNPILSIRVKEQIKSLFNKVETDVLLLFDRLL
ncbi:MAG: hypothetical protein B2I17_02155 [Thermoplasmatales archaeon B_DKE]|nr:MAG: hypothetical protein B2I17_02155 [Thermoplasmatales archaeon B_DKE]